MYKIVEENEMYVIYNILSNGKEIYCGKYSTYEEAYEAIKELKENSIIDD